MSARPIRLPADLDILPTLVVESFQYPENPTWGVQADESQSMADQWKAIRRLFPILRLLGVAIPSLRDMLNGFVWEEDGKPVGLVNAMPRGLNNEAWLIGNVSVLPAYRRRGIARSLVEAAVELARSRGAQTVMLEVIAGNVPAYELYQAMGFTAYSHSFEMSFDAAATPIPEDMPLPVNYGVVKTPLRAWQEPFAFAQRITPPDVQVYQPVKESDFRIPLLLRALVPLLNRMSGVENHRFRLDHGPSGEVGQTVGLVNVSARRRAGGVNHLGVRVDPAHSDTAETLLRWGVRNLHEMAPGRRIDTEIAAWQAHVRDAALRIGFQQRCELVAMGMKLG